MTRSLRARGRSRHRRGRSAGTRVPERACHLARRAREVAGSVAAAAFEDDDASARFGETERGDRRPEARTDHDHIRDLVRSGGR